MKKFTVNNFNELIAFCEGAKCVHGHVTFNGVPETLRITNKCGLQPPDYFINQQEQTVGGTHHSWIKQLTLEKTVEGEPKSQTYSFDIDKEEISETAE